MQVDVGSRIGPYEVISLLGHGGMGRVYLARDTRLNRTVALKVLAVERAGHPEAQERLRREARAIASLNHPHICALYDFGTIEGADYLVMEHLEGETLEMRLTRGPLELDDALDRAIEIAEALDFAHRAGIVHRDLKPANVMLTRTGAKLLDFGIAVPQPDAELARRIEESRLTATGAMLGTPRYMAPEQLDGREADARTDLFALGLLLFEMVTGQEAFEGEGAVLASAILRDDPPLVSTLRPETAPLDRVINRLLTKDPDQRWQTATDLIAELKWIRGVPDTPAPRRTRTQATLRTQPRPRRWILVAATAGVAAVALAVFVFRDALRTVDPPAVRFTIPVEPVNALSFGGALGARLAISPDGTRLVFVAEDLQGGQLYVRPLDSLQATPIPGTRGAISAFFSPGGDWVGFFAGGKLKKVRVGGDQVVTICDAIEGVGASWGPDGAIVFAPSPVSPLFRVSSNGGAPQPLTTLVNGETSHRWPEILPGGKAIVFAAASGPDFTGSRIVAQALGSGVRTDVTEGTHPRYTRTGHLVFARDSAIFGARFDPKSLALSGNPMSIVGDLSMNSTTGAALFAVSAAGTLVYRARVGTFAQRQMVWVKRDGVEEAISEDRRPYLQPRISPDGRRVAIAIGEVAADRDVWVYDLERRTTTRLTFEIGEDETPVWSRDGTKIAISAARQGQPRSIFTLPASGGSKATEIATTKFITHLGDWLPDGGLAWTDYDPAKGGDIRMLSPGGARSVRDFIVGGFNERSPAFSRDGHWVAYTSTETGQSAVFVQSVTDPSGKWAVSPEGGSQPIWSPDGKELYYRGPTHVMAVPFTTTAGFSAGKPVPLFPDKYDREHRDDRNYDIARDGRFLMLKVQAPPGPPQLHVVLNWFRELRDRTEAR